MEPAPITELVEFCCSRIPPGRYYVADHVHYCFQLVIVLSNEVVLRLSGGKRLTGHRGDVWLIQPLLGHGFESRRGYLQGSFKFHLAPEYGALFGEGVGCLHVSPDVLNCIKLADRHQKSKGILSEHVVKAVLMICLGELFAKDNSKIKGGDVLDPFRRYLWPILERISNDPYAHWTVLTMSKACHVSPGHFSKCFHKMFNVTPQQYLLQTRMRAVAATLSVGSSTSIKELAEKSNYSSVHSFTRAFTKIFGVSPAAYRRSQIEL